MLALADRAAAEIHSGAVFDYGGVSASYAGWQEGALYTGPLTGGLKLSVSYQRPDGGTFDIELEDAAPQSTLRKLTQFAGRSELGVDDAYPEFGIAYRDQLSRVKISPREAVAITWNQAQAEVAKSGIQGVSLDPLVNFNHWDAEWSIGYWLERPVPTPGPQQGKEVAPVAPTPTRGLTSLFDPTAPAPDLLMGFDVDAVNGQITKVHYFMFPRATESPSPAP